jgi:hypothetical protein
MTFGQLKYKKRLVDKLIAGKFIGSWLTKQCAGKMLFDSNDYSHNFLFEIICPTDIWSTNTIKEDCWQKVFRQNDF